MLATDLSLTNLGPSALADLTSHSVFSQCLSEIEAGVAALKPGDAFSSTPAESYDDLDFEPPANQTVFLLDWDDTLMATTSLFVTAADKPIPDMQTCSPADVAQLECVLLKFLHRATKLGRVIIITNASAGWVEHTARACAPRVLDFILAREIKIVTARVAFMEKFPNNPFQWKIQAFTEELKGFREDDVDKCVHVVACGDSIADRIAADVATRTVKQMLLKFVKFSEKPSLQALIWQLNNMVDNMLAMVKAEKSLFVNAFYPIQIDTQ